MDEDAQAAFAKRIAALLDAEGAAYDIGAYRDAPGDCVFGVVQLLKLLTSKFSHMARLPSLSLKRQ